MVRFEEGHSASVLNTLKVVHGVWVRHYVNPYRGCQLGCVYCYARGTKYHMHADFDTRIIAKENAAELLEQRIANARTLQPDVVGLSGATDAYQPLERRFGITRRVLEVLCRHRFPVSVVTKSPLVARDADMLLDLDERAWSCVTITLTTLDERLARVLEPHAPEPERRLAAVEMLADAGVRVGVAVMPMIPRITDDRAGLELLARRARESGAGHIIFGGLRLESGVRQVLRSALREHFPGELPALERLYRGGDAIADNGYLENLETFLRGLKERLNISSRVPRWIPEDQRRVNFLVSEALLNTAHDTRRFSGVNRDYYWAGQRVNNLPYCISTLADDVKHLGAVTGTGGALLEEVRALALRFSPERRGTGALFSTSVASSAANEYEDEESGALEIPARPGNLF